MEFLDKSTIRIDRELSELDRFSLEFIDVLKKYTDYVIVGGYVAILLGRARASEDVDIIVPEFDFPTFRSFYDGLEKEGFYCLNASENDTIFGYLENGSSIRFSRNEQVIPNVELRWAENKFDRITLEKKITVKLSEGDIYISPLELQIAFKEEVLKTPKDMEDAQHIRNVAQEYLNENLIEKYKVMLREFY
ncbi:hypothetical protein AKJ62_00020 [candidate division MSBL1 archaeon SCGC-AAA259D14]|uniref:Nucleotidyltransferase n=1 Tax=candidate division MSBL1 archaeon SCGC-AAA259D14 TaxID=1698261 RepID=A0A133U951_9EURY|nr:hypothetical protein AKJ62_00020 [candidate division MSBL1 archaeon SCGC-AAA259D14]